jgi:hypothetical protein
MKAVQARRRWQTVVIHGDSGAGKTTLAATAPKPAFLDSNQGLISIAERPGLEHVHSEDVFSIKDLDTAYDNFTGTGRRDWSTRYGSLVFDHWDDIQGMVLDELAERALEKDADREADQIEQREYGIMYNKLARYLRKFKRVPIHKILICSSKEDFNTGQVRPNLIGQMKDRLPYFVDHTFYLRIGKKGVRYLHMDATDEFYAKTRAWWLPPEARKIRINFKDTSQLSSLFALIAAGPKPEQRKPPTEETDD